MTKAMVLQEMHVDAVRRTKARMLKLCMRTPLQAWAELVVAPQRAKNKLARDHFHGKLLQRVLAAWSEFYDDHMGAVTAKVGASSRTLLALPVAELRPSLTDSTLFPHAHSRNPGSGSSSGTT